MIKQLSGLTIALCFLCSCGGAEDPAFCDCLDAVKKLEQQSVKILEGDYRHETMEEQVRLRREKEKLCKAYDTIDGETSGRLKKQCEEK